MRYTSHQDTCAYQKQVRISTSNPKTSILLTNSLLSTLLSSEFVYSDTMGNVTAINAATGIQTGRFKGIAGAVIDLYACEKYPYLVTVSLDRRCKVFEELGQRRIIKDVRFNL